MSEIKYVVVCKKGYLFTTDINEIAKFINNHGREIAYYIGYFNPVENTDFIFNVDNKIENLGLIKNY